MRLICQQYQSLAKLHPVQREREGQPIKIGRRMLMPYQKLPVAIRLSFSRYCGEC